MEIIPVLLILLVLIVVIPRGVVLVKESQRLVVYRHGKFNTVLGPGIVIVIPVVDKPILVNMSKHVPDWQSMNEHDICERLKMLTSFDPDPSKYK